MITFLEASGRAADILETHDIYGWLIGDWELNVLHYAGADFGVQNAKGEAHFAWVLDGRAVQDVWSWRPQMHGTTLRVWDPAIQAWRVTWFNPVSGARVDLTGHRNGKDIVQVGTYPNGTPIRWIFSEITADSFRWTGEALNPDGATWRLEGEFRAQQSRSNAATPQPSNQATQQPSNPATKQPSNPATPQPSNPATQQPSNPATQQPRNPATQQPSTKQPPQQEGKP